MNILFVYSELVVEVSKEGKYYHNFLGDITKRYSPFGNLTVCVSKKDVENATEKEIKNSQMAKFVFLNKENTIKSRYFNRKQNIKSLESQIKETDFIIVHVPCSVQDLVAKFASRYSKPFLSVVVGCPWDSLWNHSFKGKLVAPASYFGLRKFMKESKHALYVTQKFLQKRYPCYGNTIGVSDVSLPDISIDKFELLRDKRIEKRNSRNDLVITSIGALIRTKGHEDVIKTLPMLRDKGFSVSYHIIGGGDSSFLKNMSKELGVENEVFFHGSIAHNRIFDLLAETDVYIQPSRQEGLPRALVEALSMACPAIATTVGGNGELLSSKWLYKPKDINTLFIKICNILDKENYLSAMKENFDKAMEFKASDLDDKRSRFIKGVIDSEIKL